MISKTIIRKGNPSNQHGLLPRESAAAAAGAAAASCCCCRRCCCYGANGQITMTVHNYKSRQVHKTLNGLNPSSVSEICISQSLDPICAKLDKFLVHARASPYGVNGQMITAVHNYRPRQFHRTWNRENPSSSYRDMDSTSQPPAHPPRP